MYTAKFCSYVYEIQIFCVPFDVVYVVGDSLLMNMVLFLKMNLKFLETRLWAIVFNLF